MGLLTGGQERGQGSQTEEEEGREDWGWLNGKGGNDQGPRKESLRDWVTH